MDKLPERVICGASGEKETRKRSRCVHAIMTEDSIKSVCLNTAVNECDDWKQVQIERRGL